ncbi:MAG TPA: hypothetical protein VKG44_03955 [Candidatus Baltobacteraceae bacterium]|nr:hypothetical protein [Candidatus Baltobacteraceae bacterium]
MPAVAHSAEAIEALLRRGLSPVTDNRDALLVLGFWRAYPQIRVGYDSTVWERSIDLPRRPDGQRALARERAYLVLKTS